MDVYDVEVEAQAKTIDEAKQLAVEKLGLSEDRIDFTVVQEGKAGFLGIGGEPAVVTARAKPASRKRRRRRRGKGSQMDAEGKQTGAKSRQRSGDARRSGSGGGRSEERVQRNRKQRDNGGKSTGEPRRTDRNESKEDGKESASIEEQASVASDFLEGLLGAFGLEGSATTRIEEDILYMDLSGDQTEALVGHRGSIMQSVLELTRTVVQRKTYGAPRMRIDIAGYAERRREALTIYTGKLVEKVTAEGGEIMLEPMNPADRKVVHDAVAALDGVRSFSEGEDPNRSVVIAATSEVDTSVDTSEVDSSEVDSSEDDET